jgi:hypothetical protein
MCADIAAMFRVVAGVSHEEATRWAVENWKAIRGRLSNPKRIADLLRRQRHIRVKLSSDQRAALRRSLVDGDDAAVWDVLRAFEAPDGTWK